MAYAKPSATFNGYTGFYSGASITITGSSSYKYLYVADTSQSYTYWLKTSSFSGSYTFTLNTDTSYTSLYKTIQIILSDTNYGSSCTVGNEYVSSLCYLQVPRFAARIYNGSSSYSTYRSDTNNLGNGLKKSGYVLKGFSTSPSNYNVTYDIASGSSSQNYWLPSYDGEILYVVHYKAGSSSSDTVTYYLGTSTAKTTTRTITTADEYLYGKGSTSGGGTTTSWSTKPSEADYSTSYKFTGWATSISTSVAASTYSISLNSYTTLYAVYKKSASTSSGYAYYYRGRNTQESVSKTTSTAVGYRYGKGSTSGGSTSTSYGTPSTSHPSDTSWVFQGWATSSTSSTVYSTTASTAWGSSNTIYAVYKKTGSSSNSNVYYYRGTNSQKTATKTTTIADSLCYGTGSTSGGGTTYTYSTPTTAHETNSNYTFLGWATSANTYTSYNSNASTQWGNSNTIYGVYSKTDTMTYYPQNGASSNNVSTTNYSYGTGSTTTNIPEEPTVTYDGYSLLGWATTSTGQEDEWNDQWNNGARTVYAIWKINTIPIQIHNGTNYIEYAVYIHNGTEYVKVIPYVHNGTIWKQLTSQ